MFGRAVVALATEDKAKNYNRKMNEWQVRK